MAVLITNRQTRHPISGETLRKTARTALNALAFPDGELSVLIVDDDDIARINSDYLNREGPTNVIAFAMREGAFSEISPQLLGDVIISADTTAREARTGGMTFEARLDELLVHGILHLFGYDHETETADAAGMEKKALEILALVRSGAAS